MPARSGYRRAAASGSVCAHPRRRGRRDRRASPATHPQGDQRRRARRLSRAAERATTAGQARQEPPARAPDGEALGARKAPHPAPDGEALVRRERLPLDGRSYIDAVCELERLIRATPDLSNLATIRDFLVAAPPGLLGVRTAEDCGTADDEKLRVLVRYMILGTKAMEALPGG